MTSLLFQREVNDPAVFAFVALLLGVRVAFLASHSSGAAGRCASTLSWHCGISEGERHR